MTTLFFFGSDRYAKIVLDHLRTSSNLTVTHLSSLISDPHSISTQPDAIGLSASFPYLFPPEIIEAFDGHLYNLHPSLLPQYRNVAPVPYALAMGDKKTGITLQRIDAKIDHGEILAQQTEPILPTDTTPVLLHRLFTLGAQLFLDYLTAPTASLTTPAITEPLIFTRKITSASGHLEWPLVLKLIHGQSIVPTDTVNPLIQLRLTHHPDRTTHILADLIRALSSYEKVWTTAPTRKGELRLEIVAGDPAVLVKLASKPRPITWSDFQKYYL